MKLPTSLHIPSHTQLYKLQLATILGHQEKSEVLSENKNVKTKFKAVDGNSMKICENNLKSQIHHEFDFQVTPLASTGRTPPAASLWALPDH